MQAHLLCRRTWRPPWAPSSSAPRPPLWGIAQPKCRTPQTQARRNLFKGKRDFSHFFFFIRADDIPSKKLGDFFPCPCLTDLLFPQGFFLMRIDASISPPPQKKWRVARSLLLFGRREDKQKKECWKERMFSFCYLDGMRRRIMKKRWPNPHIKETDILESMFDFVWQLQLWQDFGKFARHL